MTPISGYAAIGEGQTVALVSATGDIDWLCWPRIDSPSIFGALLDPGGGTFSVRPAVPMKSRRQYLDDTNVLVTRWEDRGAALDVVDWMPAVPDHERADAVAPESSVVRVVHCVQGRVPVRVRFDPKPDYGRSRARVTHHPKFGARVHTPDGCLSLTASRPLQFHQGVATVWLEGGESLALALTWSSEAPAVYVDAAQFAAETLGPTIRFWRSFAARVRYDGPHRSLVVRSALALKLLIYAPSGAVVAAGTTSLPERLGGDLNWDYRFCWVRDASLTVRALLGLGFDEEADAYVSWLLHASRLTRPRIGVLYDVYGRTPHDEELLDHWAGYGGSKPVRIRNRAADQLQLDAYGEVIDAIAHLFRKGRTLDREAESMLRDFGEYVCRNWERPDAGIWEIRGEDQQFTHSKVLCWVALERILEMDGRSRFRRLPRELFEKNRALLREAIERRAWSDALQTYTQTFDGHRLDASLLLMDWYGFEDGPTHRMRSTARALLRRLSPRPGLLYRYDQSLETGEGAFVICAFWLSEFLARGGGSLEGAERLFREASSFANDVGLLSEEVDPVTGALLGNAPQAFSHVGLISAACALEERRRTDAGARTEQEVRS